MHTNQCSFRAQKSPLGDKSRGAQYFTLRAAHAPCNGIQSEAKMVAGHIALVVGQIGVCAYYISSALLLFVYLRFTP